MDLHYLRETIASTLANENPEVSRRLSRYPTCTYFDLENLSKGGNMKPKILFWGGGRRRSWKREALMIGATAGIATAVGALAAGKKGATFGGLSGGVTRFLMRFATW
jgi:hypothetical protein